MKTKGFSNSAPLWAGVLLAAIAACSTGATATGNDAGAAGPDPAADGGPVCPAITMLTCPDPPPHYADVGGIFRDRCVPCHDDQPDAAWPLQTYRQIADWQDVIVDDLIRCTMPPADGGVTMTEEERLAMLTWLHCGYQE